VACEHQTQSFGGLLLLLLLLTPTSTAASSSSAGSGASLVLRLRVPLPWTAATHLLVGLIWLVASADRVAAALPHCEWPAPTAHGGASSSPSPTDGTQRASSSPSPDAGAAAWWWG
jgi:hypothetical protein